MPPTNYNTLSKSILKTLLYFDIFQYPLTTSEVFNRLTTNHVSEDDVKQELVRLSNESIIFSFSEFFSIQNNYSLISRRIEGNRIASKGLIIAQRRARVISKFPFVLGVMASGSLSKDFMDENSDVDFFIITKRNRLWTARMLLALYQKIFLLNSHKYFCINYLIDEDHLEIEEKNIFTAIELATLIPLHGKEFYLQLLKANNWINEYLPNYRARSTNNAPTQNTSWIKQQLEKILDLLGANRMEPIFMNIMSSHWKKQYQSAYSELDYQLAFKAKESVSKAHPKNHQSKVLDLYQKKLEEFGAKMNVNWNE